MALLLLGGVVLLGAFVQWLTGMGFALVSVPALVIILGPADGVTFANCAAGVVCLLGLARGWRYVRLRAMIPLVLAAACTAPLGAWFARVLPAPILLITMGTLVTLTAVLLLSGLRIRSLRGLPGALTAGATGGFMNTAAGLGGPPVSLYAVNAGWTIREFVPNALFYGATVNLFSLLTRGIPPLTSLQWLTTAAALPLGATLGALLTPRIPNPTARTLVLLLATTGGLLTTAKGLSAL
ncbi:sulfite exporter TauE/SafE family protein [Kribbella sp.]|uniref:sulfite exporter TauE/SafE family protein n=1 Tax=Kribbella sp. TaxID=1871183 RepID=UPI002D30AFCE|nr:sulfite exporter TauE/SafE family protein [Kribbella sp.]HZX09070.1 sulfite exporter TauE/SafE family protein [Kribbella sp.]